MRRNGTAKSLIKNKNKCKASIRKAIKSELVEDFDSIDASYKHRHVANWYYW